MSQMRSFAALLALILVCCQACGPQTDYDSPDRQKNIVLVVVDTLRADAILNRKGDGFARKTLRDLERDSAVFQKCFSHASLTIPSHTALFSSRLPSESGVRLNHDKIPASVPLVTRWLREHGYFTGSVTSMLTLQRSGLDRDFEVRKRADQSLRWVEDSFPLYRDLLEETPKGNPFFHFIHLVDPHLPYRVHDDPRIEFRVFFNGELFEMGFADQPIYVKRSVRLRPGKNEIRFEGDDAFALIQCGVHGKSPQLEATWVRGELNQLLTEAIYEIVNEKMQDIEVVLYFATYDMPNDHSSICLLYTSDAADE